MVAGSISLSPNMEDYLETIFHLVRTKTVARSKDIARKLEVKRSSVTGALRSLSQKGLVDYEPYGYVTLTRDGTEIATKIVRRHEALRDFFVRVLSIDAVEADEAACKMEHGVSKQIVDRLLDFADFVEVCPRAGAKWIHGFGYQCADKAVSKETCERCMQKNLDAFIQEPNHKEKDNAPETFSLSKLQPGERGQIIGIKGQSSVKKRIRDMGITGGTVVEVVRIAPLGDPIEVKVKGYHLTLRKEEAQDISVKRICS